MCAPARELFRWIRLVGNVLLVTAYNSRNTPERTIAAFIVSLMLQLYGNHNTIDNRRHPLQVVGENMVYDVA